ncbi:TetR/AcrR family transcriptional regulator [Rhodocytophaga rosea]|uniref:TetR/AcrR family transcriptional regulator n=1 Tax=Rhodocytophaga rosea TaxID=2704465 RepID=A0A6C0GSH9_9BACT|nr:TetR/AcrR family transcriptional regulator [Rhodocytophaga rosea]QHT71059.1 TetR/AcrR family transcriptional regulator [Rhodocytophaga rosea]
MMKEELDTQNRIKEAARRVFLRQGFDGAKIRQIAEEAGVNVALVNYYFRSKEQLFKSVYKETFGVLFGKIVMLLNEETPLEVKIWKIVDKYTDLIMENPLMPMFVLSENREDGNTLFKDLNVREVIRNSYFTKQLQEEIQKGNIREVAPLHIIFSILGNVVFPFLARPAISYMGDLNEEGFRKFMEERKKIIPEMIMAYLKVK